MESIKKIRNVLGIGDEAVGVKYTDDSPMATTADGQYAVCNGILEAANGKVIMLSAENCACLGGKTHLGLTETRGVALRMLVEGEKLWCDVKTATRSRIESLKIASPPLGRDSSVVVGRGIDLKNKVG